jgi:hypothetical protein
MVEAGGVEPPVLFSSSCNYRKILSGFALARKCKKKADTFGSRNPPSSSAFISIMKHSGILSKLHR